MGITKPNVKYNTLLESGVGYFVIDSLEEIDLIDRYASDTVNVVLRVNPGVEAHTHEFIQTGQEDSKFGLSIRHGLRLKRSIKCATLKRYSLPYWFSNRRN